MSPQLQAILDAIKNNADLGESEREALVKSIKEADKAQSLSQFKLDRLEKDRNTLTIMLQESIDDLQKKSRAIEAQNRELEIESSLEKVRTVAMGMRKRDDMLDICRIISGQLELLGIKEIRNVQTAIFYEHKGTYINYEYYRLHGKALVTEVDYTSDEISVEFAAQMIKGADEVFVRNLEGQEVKDWLTIQKTTNVFIDTNLENAKSLTYYWFSLGQVAIGMSAYDPLSEEEIALFKRFRNVFDLAYRRYLDIEKAEAQAREAQIEAALEKVRSRSLAMHKSDELQEVVHAVFERLNELNFELDTAIIIIFTEGSKDTVWWLQNSANQQYLRVAVNYADIFYLRNLFEAKENKKDLPPAFYSFEQKNELLNYLFDHTDFRFTPPEQKEFLLRKECATMSTAIATNTAIHITRYSKKSFSEKEDEILKKFSNVFEQAYTRFLDLQKAEAQARESQIQLALERVRARTMAMQRSDELKGAAALLFQQVKTLGVPAYSCGYNIWEKNETTFTSWMSTQDGSDFNAVLNIPLTEDANFIRYVDSKQKGEQFFVLELRGERMQEHYEYLKTIPAFKAYFDYAESVGFDLPKTQIHYIANFSQGNLLFITLEPCPEFHDVFKRFAKVFDQTYTRFLDLQKAEAQAREARIEAALERTRTQSMLMQHSKELDDTLRVFHEQVLLLGIHSEFSFLWLPDEEKDRHIFWAAWAENNLKDFKSKAIDYPLDRNEPATAQCLVDWKSDQPVVSYHVPPGGVESYFTAWQELIAGVEELKSQNFSDGLYYVEAFMKYGCFGVMIKSDLSEDEKKILYRFTIEFERTYTRFLDLQKAEAQAREAQIEAALERVRSRSMGMQKSEELREVIQVVYDQFVHLNIHVEHTGFVIDYKTRDDYDIWIADQLGVPSHVTIPYFDCVYYNRFNEAKKKGEDFFATNLDFEEKNRFYKKIIEYIPGLPEETKEFLFSIPGLAGSTVLLDNVCLYIENFSGIPYSDEENNTLMRFGKVFQQTYTRFLDLQKAEAQALEAIKRASVDRVRAEIASMRTTNDLERITPLMWNELTTLGVPFIRCGVFIMDEEKQLVETHLSTPDGKAIASFTSTFSGTELLTEILPYWQRKEVYKAHWDEAAFLEQAKSLVEQGSVTNSEKYLTENRPTDLYLHFLPFLQGMLYVGNTSSFSDDELQLVQNLADAFSTAYARYEDFNKLEVAKQQIEKTLVDLKQAQQQLVQSEKMASLGELTAGIAHEIQNPLNFVNNFSDVNKELLEELKEEADKGNIEEIKAIANDVINNEEKINHHGKRADAIVKNMLQHSRSSGATKELTDINKLADEYLRLSYHGLRAKDKSFNADFKTELDNSIGKINVIPQDMGRVMLNLINNAFYAVNERQKLEGAGYKPNVTISTASIQPPLGGRSVQIKVADNGSGIPQKIVDKIFQPFFTTKPTGQGTGLGLSLSYDIIKAHGGEIKVSTKEGEGTEFMIQLPAIQ